MPHSIHYIVLDRDVYFYMAVEQIIYINKIQIKLPTDVILIPTITTLDSHKKTIKLTGA